MDLAIFQQQIVPVRSKLFRFALRITGSRHEAEDVVQDVLEKIWKAPDEQKSAVQNWEAWCMTLTRNRSIDKNRSRSLRRTDEIDGLVGRVSPQISPEKTAESNDTVGQIQKMMQDLPEKQRLVMHLRDIEEMTYEEIAETLEISLEQVKICLHRARKSMREKLMEVDGGQWTAKQKPNFQISNNQ